MTIDEIRDHVKTFSQMQLAKSMRCSRMHVWYVLNGDRKPSEKILTKLANRLSIDVEDLDLYLAHVRENRDPYRKKKARFRKKRTFARFMEDD